MHHRFTARIAGLAMLLATFGAYASDAPFVSDEALDPAVFPQVADQIRAEMTALDGAYVKLSNGDKRRVNRALDRIAEQLGSGGNRDTQRIAGLQYQINSMLAPQVHSASSGSEIICRRVKKVGSNLRETQCKTRAELDAEAREIEETRRLQRLPPLPRE